MAREIASQRLRASPEVQLGAYEQMNRDPSAGEFHPPRREPPELAQAQPAHIEAQRLLEIEDLNIRMDVELTAGVGQPVDHADLSLSSPPHACRARRAAVRSALGLCDAAGIAADALRKLRGVRKRIGFCDEPCLPRFAQLLVYAGALEQAGERRSDCSSMVPPTALKTVRRRRERAARVRRIGVHTRVFTARRTGETGRLGGVTRKG